MPTQLQPLDQNLPIVETGRGLGVTTGSMTRAFSGYLRALTTRVERSGYSVLTSPDRRTGQSASIGLTSLVPQASGLYRVQWRFRVTTAATTSSSLQVTITTTDGTITVTQSSAAYTGNATNAPQSGIFIVRCDAGVPLQFSTTYASVGATPMQYEIEIVPEQL
jgi:hypothetical protein